MNSRVEIITHLVPKAPTSSSSSLSSNNGNTSILHQFFKLNQVGRSPRLAKQASKPQSKQDQERGRDGREER